MTETPMSAALSVLAIAADLAAAAFAAATSSTAMLEGVSDWERVEVGEVVGDTVPVMDGDEDGVPVIEGDVDGVGVAESTVM